MQQIMPQQQLMPQQAYGAPPQARVLTILVPHMLFVLVKQVKLNRQEEERRRSFLEILY